jgi:antitoxin component YwqK of YwqJK toxin-antitoxin module
MRYKGAYTKNGLKEGTWLYFDPKGRPEEQISFSKGIKEGEYTKWNTRGGGTESFGTYKNGLKQGAWAFYYETGVLQSKQTFTEGKLDGPCEAFHENSKPLSKTHYILIPDKAGVLKSVPHGVWQYWDYKGNLTNTLNYVRGIRK